MNKLVYLFELDSVNTSKKEIEYGQLCMYKEILYNGNQIVITFNQLTDSNVLLRLISNEKYYASLVRLFEIGAIKISMYKNMNDTIYSPSQYVQLSIDKCLAKDTHDFLFSTLPIKSSDKEFLNIIKKSLQFSSIEILKEYIEKSHDINELKYEFIINFIRFILDISKFENIFNPPKSEHKKMVDFLNYIFSLNFSVEFEYKYNITKVLEVLRKLNVLIDLEHKNNRSVWYSKLQEYCTDIEKENYKLAESIIDICYNYAVEDSILNVSKYYAEGTLAEDMYSRIKYQFEIMGIKNEHNFLENDADIFVDYKKIKLENWDKLIRDIEYIYLYDYKKINHQGILYEVDIKVDKLYWNVKKSIAVVFNILNIIILIFVAIIMDYCLDFLEDTASVISIADSIKIFNLLLITTVINMCISKFIDIPEHSDSFLKIYTIIKDFIGNITINMKVGYYYEKYK